MARIALGVLFVAAAVLLGGCGSKCPQSGSACGRATFNCPYDVDVYAKVPQMSGTWTVTGCLNGSCYSADLLPESMIGGRGFVTVEVQPGPMLLVTLGGSKSDEGKTWSLRVVDSQGNVIVQGNGTVHHEPNPGGCPDAQQVNLP